MKRRRPGLAISESGVLIIGLVKIKWDRLVPPMGHTEKFLSASA